MVQTPPDTTTQYTCIMYGLYGLKPHIVEISEDVTDPDGRTNERTTRKYRATQLLIWEPMSFAIIFMLTGTTRSFATWSLNIWSTRTAETTWLADLDVLLKSMWLYTVCVKLSNAKSFIKVNLLKFVYLLFFTRSKRLPSRVNRWEEEALGPWRNSQVTNSKDFMNIKRWKTSQTSQIVS